MDLYQGFAKVAWLSEDWPPAAAKEREKKCGAPGPGPGGPTF